MKRRIFSVLAALVLLSAMCTAVFAHDVPDMTRTGSVSVTLRHSEGTLSGGSLTVYRVGQVREDDGNYSFALTEEFAGSGLSLEDLQSAALPEALAAYAKEQNLTGETRQIDENGNVKFENMELGLYLFVQNEPAPGYNAVSPFLTGVPANVDGVYVYDVDASPKVAPATEKPTQPPTEPEPTKPADPTLPQTGQLNWPVSVLAVLGILLFAAGWMLRRSQYRGNHEA